MNLWMVRIVWLMCYRVVKWRGMRRLADRRLASLRKIRLILVALYLRKVGWCIGRDEVF